MSMLSMFNYTFFKDTASNRKLFFKSKVLYIDDSFLYQDNSRTENVAKIEEICKNSGFPYEIIMLENVLKLNFSDLESTPIEYNKTDEALIKDLVGLINTFPSN